MGIRDIPETWQAFARLLDAYERDHFAFDHDGRTVAEATLALVATFPPNGRLPAALVRRISLAIWTTRCSTPSPSRIPSRVTVAWSGAG